MGKTSFQVFKVGKDKWAAWGYLSFEEGSMGPVMYPCVNLPKKELRVSYLVTQREKPSALFFSRNVQGDVRFCSCVMEHIMKVSKVNGLLDPFNVKEPSGSGH